jgi:hypothetical protein
MEANGSYWELKGSLLKLIACKGSKNELMGFNERK